MACVAHVSSHEMYVIWYGSEFTLYITVTLGCGKEYAQNCTYFDSSSPTAGSCSARVCEANNNICQMRLDFNTFTLTGPSTSAITESTYAHDV